MAQPLLWRNRPLLMGCPDEAMSRDLRLDDRKGQYNASFSLRPAFSIAANNKKQTCNTVRKEHQSVV